MKLYRHFKPVDHQKIHEDVKAAYGIERPERIGGYYGIFHAQHNDVYLSDTVSREAERSQEFSEYIDDCIKRFFEDDLGFVTESEYNAFVEDKYIANRMAWYLGRYSKRHMRSVILANLHDIIYISFVEENAYEIYTAQYKKSPYFSGKEDAIELILQNEIRYTKYPYGQL